ncbi:hypothetical protein SDC9_159196 [bioreactor metagenome]|uniref:Uncharacterized protein n=1 Tax=bioreactor metagenome TaxID=1076179 RepID=A0A645FC82_9ZZZZ
MSHLIGRLHVNIREVIAVFCKCADCRHGLPLVIGMQASVGAFHDDAVHARSHRDSF